MMEKYKENNINRDIFYDEKNATKLKQLKQK